MIEYNQSKDAEPGKEEELTFKVIGVGGSGANVLDRLALEGSDDAQLLVLNTDVRKLSSSVSSQKVQLGAALLKGMGTGGDPDLGRRSAEEATEEIREAIRGNDMVFVCVGLGGGTGSGAAPEVCRIAREEGVFLVAFTTMPFEFEGARRMEQAEDALRKIDSYANAVITFDNDRMGELIVPKDGVTQAFAAADKIISQAIRATMNIVSKPGIIRIGMDDLLTALNSNNSRCLFGYGQAKGDNRALEAVDQTLKCPLLDNGQLLNDAKNVLIQVSGSDSMTLLEVQTVMKELTTHLKKNAHVLFGTGTDARLGSSLAVTVISSLDGKASGAPSVEEPEVSSQLSEAVTQSPLAAAVTAAAAAAVGEAADIATAHSAVEPVMSPHDPIEHSEPNIVPMEPVADEETVPAASVAGEEDSSIVPMPQFASEGPDPLMTNPIANAIQEGETEPAPQPQPPALPGTEPADEPHHDKPAAVGEDAAVVEAQTDQSQTIALSRIVPGKASQRILNRPPKEGETTDQPEGDKVTPMPSQEEQIEQQQDILHLEPVDSKGRFASGDPTIVDGEDLDVPTFLRKKG